MASVKKWLKEFKERLTLPMEFVVILVIVFIVTRIIPGIIPPMGIVPRRIPSLLGILFYPLVHFSTSHLIANSISILILGCFISIFSKRNFIGVTLFSWFVSGLLIWTFARGGTLVGGASGIVFGYLGFLMLRGLFDRKFLYILLSAVSIFLFHGMLTGLLPTQGAISWEGHLFGFIAGAFYAFLLSGKKISLNKS